MATPEPIPEVQPFRFGLRQMFLAVAILALCAAIVGAYLQIWEYDNEWEREQERGALLWTIEADYLLTPQELAAYKEELRQLEAEDSAD